MKKLFFNQYLILLLAMLCSLLSHAEVNYLRGSNEIEVGEILAVETQFYQLNAPIEGKMLKTFVRLKYDDLKVIDGEDDFTIKVTYVLHRWDRSNNVLPDLNGFLELKHDKLKKEVLDEQVQEFEGAHKVELEITAIQGKSHIIDEMILEVDLDYVFVGDFQYGFPVYGVDHTYEATTGECTFNWNYFLGANSYELEWVFVSDELVNEVAPGPHIYKNATRVVTSMQHYTIAIPYGKGNLYYRVRAVRNAVPQANILKRYTAWSSGQQHLEINDNNWHASTENWSYTAMYSSNGLKSEQITYVDATGRVRQQIVKDELNGNLIVGEQKYGYNGEPSIQTLPGIVLGKSLNFIEGFTKTASGEVFDKQHFASDAKLINPDQLASSPTDNNNYFSQGNTFKNDGLHSYVADAEGYGYAQTMFDAQGRVTKVSGVGANHKMGSTHEVEIWYSGVNQDEIDRLFGNEVGYADHYSAVMTKDANGVLSTSYYNLSGQLIATAIAGNKPANLEDLDITNYAKTTPANVDLASHNEFLTDSTVVNYDLKCEKDQPYSFKYEVTREWYNNNCTETNSECKYILEVYVSNNQGVKMPLTITAGGGGITSTTYFKKKLSGATFTAADKYILQFSASLLVGQYKVYKVLKIDKEALKEDKEAYADLLKDNASAMCNNGLPSLSTLQTEFENKFTEGLRCDACEQSCASFTDAYYTYKEKNQNSTLTAEEAFNDYSWMTNLEVTQSYEFNSNRDWPWQTIYDGCLTKRCENGEGLKPSTPAVTCSSILKTLKSDVSPGGQYFDNKSSDGDPLDLSASAANPNWLISKGVPVPSNNLGVSTWSANDYSTLRSNWNESWANSMVQYHPEYCEYSWCILTEPYNQFNLDVMSMNYQEAKTKWGGDPMINNYIVQNDNLENKEPSDISGGAVNDLSYDAVFPNLLFWDEWDDRFEFANLFSYPHNQECNGSLNNLYDLAKCSAEKALEKTLNHSIAEDREVIWATYKTMYLGLRTRFLSNIKAQYKLSECPNVPAPITDINVTENELFSKAPYSYYNTSTGKNYAIRFPDLSKFIADDVNYSALNNKAEDVANDELTKAPLCSNYSLTFSFVNAYGSQNPHPLFLASKDYTDKFFRNDVGNDIQLVFVEGTTHIKITDDLYAPTGQITLERANQFINEFNDYGSGLNITFNDVTSEFTITQGTSTIDLSRFNYLQYIPGHNAPHVWKFKNECCGEKYCFSEKIYAQSFDPYSTNMHPVNLKIQGLKFMIGNNSLEEFNNYQNQNGSSVNYWNPNKFVEIFSIPASYFQEAFGSGDPFLISCDLIKTTIGDYLTAHYPQLEFSWGSEEQTSFVSGNGCTIELNVCYVDKNNEVFGNHVWRATNGFTYVTDANAAPTNDCLDDEFEGACFCDRLLEIRDEEWLKAYKVHAPVKFGDNVLVNDQNVSDADIQEAVANRYKDMFPKITTQTCSTCTPQKITNNYDGQAHYSNWMSKCIAKNYSFLNEANYGNTNPSIELQQGCMQEDCKEEARINAKEEAEKKWNLLYEGQLHKFESEYIAHCLKGSGSANETFEVNYTSSEYQYTLYYYDLAGNLVATVYPEGVRILSDDQVNQVQAFRNTGVNTASLTDGPIYLENQHIVKQVNSFTYNTLGEVVTSHSVDAGDSKFYYDNLGRLIFSQNAQQAVPDINNMVKYSYTNFDYIGRISETGETKVSANVPLTDDICLGKSSATFSLEAWRSLGTKAEVTKVYYDTPLLNSVYHQSAKTEFNDYAKNKGLEYTRNRITGVLFFEDNVSSVHPNYSQAYYYGYNVHGLAESFVQEHVMLRGTLQEFKTINYDFDLFTGLVNKVAYQPGKEDAFYSKYEYDQLQRLLRTYTSADDVLYNQESKNIFYLHGAKARIELGKHQVQGIDLAYTVRGELKGMNSSTLNARRDIGSDGNVSVTNNYQGHSGAESGKYKTANKFFARDAAGFNLHYFAGDYKTVGNVYEQEMFAPKIVAGSNAASQIKDLYNGSISASATAIYDQDPTDLSLYAQSQLSIYSYDMMYRLKEVQVMRSNDVNQSNSWQNAGLITASAKEQSAYYSHINYDMNGNIKQLKRRSYNAQAKLSVAMDDLNYFYNYSGANLQSNRLYHVTDNVNQITPSNDYSGNRPFDADAADVETQNYFVYDNLGNIIKNEADGYSIEWTASRKVKSITKESYKSGSNLEFKYDAFGRRICKIIKTRTNQGNGQMPNYVEDPQSQWKYEFYALDASGNILATYEHQLTASAPIADSRSSAVIKLNTIDFTGSGGAPSLHLSIASPQNTEVYSASGYFGPFNSQLVSKINSNPASLFNASLATNICEQCIYIFPKQNGPAFDATTITATGNYNSLITVLKPMSGALNRVNYNVQTSKIKENLIYADARLGVLSRDKVLQTTAYTAPSSKLYSNTAGQRHYEVVNWLGSVLAVVKDMKYWESSPAEGTIYSTSFEGGDESMFRSSSDAQYVTSDVEKYFGDKSLRLEAQNGMTYGHFGPNIREHVKAGNTVKVDVQTLWKLADGTASRGGGVVYEFQDENHNRLYNSSNQELWFELTVNDNEGTWFNRTSGTYTVPVLYNQNGTAYTRNQATLVVYPWVANNLNATYFDDLKVTISRSNEQEQYFAAVIEESHDYHEFGMEMNGRGFHGDYRFGYQGSEKDNEVSGDGNSYTTEFRQLDPRLGRWFSVDPVFQPWQSPYTSMDNDPINHNDPKGDFIPLITGAIGAVVGGATGFVGDVASQFMSGRKFSEIEWKKAGKSAIKGAIVGGAVGAAGPFAGLWAAGAGVVVGGGVEAADDYISQKIETGVFKANTNFWLKTGGGAILGGLGGFLGGWSKSFLKYTPKGYGWGAALKEGIERTGLIWGFSGVFNGILGYKGIKPDHQMFTGWKTSNARKRWFGFKSRIRNMFKHKKIEKPSEIKDHQTGGITPEDYQTSRKPEPVVNNNSNGDDYFVQAGAFKDETRAEARKKEVEDKNPNETVSIVSEGGFFKVRMQAKDESDAVSKVDKLKEQGYDDSFKGKKDK